MNEPTNDNKFEHEINNDIVLTDYDIAKLQRAREVYVKLLLKQRLAIFAEAKALAEATSVPEELALESWKRKTQVAKEFETFCSVTTLLISASLRPPVPAW